MDEDLDLLLLDRALLRVPLECLSSSVRMLQKVLKVDSFRLTSYAGRHLAKSFDRRYTSSDSYPMDLLRKNSEGYEIMRLSFNGDLPSFNSSLTLNSPLLNSSTPVLNSSAPVLNSSTLDLAQHIAALEDLERRYNESILAVAKVVDFIKKMKAKVNLKR